MAKALLRVNTTESHSYDDNDIVVIVEDDHIFGTMELDINVFNIVDIPGKTVQELQYLMEPDLGSPIDSMPAAFKRNPRLMIKYLLNKNELSKRKLNNQRRYKIENDQIIDKRKK